MSQARVYRPHLTAYLPDMFLGRSSCLLSRRCLSIPHSRHPHSRTSPQTQLRTTHRRRHSKPVRVFTRCRLLGPRSRAGQITWSSSSLGQCRPRRLSPTCRGRGRQTWGYGSQGCLPRGEVIITPRLDGREGRIHRREGRGSQRLGFDLARLWTLSGSQLEHDGHHHISPLMWQTELC